MYSDIIHNCQQLLAKVEVSQFAKYSTWPKMQLFKNLFWWEKEGSYFNTEQRPIYIT